MVRPPAPRAEVAKSGRASGSQAPAVPRPRLVWLLLSVPASLLVSVRLHHPLLLFVLAALALVPLAEIIGICTEQLALHAGPRVGGLLNATLANLTELILSTLLVLQGQIRVVKASLTGAILGNLLLVLGLALFAGGLRQRVQRYSAPAAGVHATSLALAVTGFLMPGLFLLTTGTHTFLQREVVSAAVAGVLIVLYLLALLFTRLNREHLFRTPLESEQPGWSVSAAVAVLAGASVLVAAESSLLARALQPALAALRISEFFAGLILIPLIGNVVENSTAIRFAVRNKMDVTLEIAIGSSTQIALFVAPVLVFISLAVRRPMDFVFSTFEVAAVAVSTVIIALICHDGRSNWLEGAQLLAAYIIIAVSAFFVAAL
jgi:Ca2+:H+ antiporter